MTRLACPFCGPRPLREFEFHKTVAAVGSTTFAQVYERIDSADVSVEHWQHVGGCRAWLFVRRNPSTGEVIECQLVHGEGGQ